MFFQPPEKEPTNTNNCEKSAGALKSARRKRRKLERKFNNKTQLLKKEKQRFANSMSSWAENFSMAATWQLKHQVAHWKSRARALEYENNILRTTLRNYYVKDAVSETTKTDNAEAMSAESERDSEEEEKETQEKEEEEDEEQEEEEEEEYYQEDGDEKVEISEEFINFLAKNARSRKMRLERKRKRKIEEEKHIRLLESCPVAPTDPKVEYEKLYGVHWQRIAALEMSLESQYMLYCDINKPVLWPTIPFRV